MGSSHAKRTPIDIPQQGIGPQIQGIIYLREGIHGYPLRRTSVAPLLATQ